MYFVNNLLVTLNINTGRLIHFLYIETTLCYLKYIFRNNNLRLGMMVHACHPCTQETEAKESHVLGHPEFQSLQCYIVRSVTSHPTKSFSEGLSIVL